MHEVDPTTIPAGTEVIAADGTRLGTVHLARPNYLLVDQPDEPHASLTVPAHAIARFETATLPVGQPGGAQHR